MTAALEFVRDLLPVYDLDFMREQMLKMNPPYEFRQDVIIALHREIARKVEAYPEMQRHSYLPVLENVSNKTLKSSGADDAKELMLAVAYRNLKMLEMGWIKDPREQGVLVSLMITMEAEQDGEEWPSISKARNLAEKMISSLHWQSVYSGVVSLH